MEGIKEKKFGRTERKKAENRKILRRGKKVTKSKKGMHKNTEHLTSFLHFIFLMGMLNLYKHYCILPHSKYMNIDF